jgi:SAM-dependent methyltransferase
MTQPAIDDRNADQIAYWNGPGGKHWTERQELQDIVLGPVSEVLIDRAAIKAGERVIDVGWLRSHVFRSREEGRPRRTHHWRRYFRTDAGPCQRAHTSRCAGRVRAGGCNRLPFAPASTDLLFSRFGVMFFAQPSDSFANMRKALRPGGRLVFACWRTPRDNPWMMIGLKEAYKFVPKLPEMKPDDPGPFSFADEERVRRILTESGFTDIGLERVDLALDIAIGRGLEAAIETVLAIGPTSRALENQPKDKVEAATQSIRTVLASHQKARRSRSADRSGS